MSISTISSLDEARAANPDLGFAIYCYEPRGPVTLEVLTPDNQTFTWIRPSLSEALAAAFPPDPVEPIDEPEPTIDIFD